MRALAEAAISTVAHDMNLSTGLQTLAMFKQCVPSSRFGEREYDVDVMKRYTRACVLLTGYRDAAQWFANMECKQAW
jgi:hypothetical protein